MITSAKYLAYSLRIEPVPFQIWSRSDDQ